MVAGFPAGGSHRISRETPFAEVLVHSKRGVDRRERRCAHRVAGERTEPARMLSGYDESFPDRDNGSRKDLRGRVVLRGQVQDRLFAAEYGCGRGLPAHCAGFASGAGALAGRSGEGQSETVRIILLRDVRVS